MSPDQEKKLNEVHAAIIGNPHLGQEGIIPRLEKLEDYKRNDQALKYKIAGAITLGTPVLVVAWSYIKSKLFGE